MIDMICMYIFTILYIYVCALLIYAKYIEAIYIIYDDMNDKNI
jgi:hypothetical protein